MISELPLLSFRIMKGIHMSPVSRRKLACHLAYTQERSEKIKRVARKEPRHVALSSGALS